MDWDEILSYYRPGKQRETLYEHINNALRYVDGVNEKRIGKFVSKNLNVKNFEELLRYAVILHDSGKAFYQSSYNIKRDKEGEYLSFYGHEYISAILSDLFISEKIRKTYDISYLSIVFAVMYHHHAMNPEHRKRAINNLAESDNNTRHLHKLHHVLSSFLNEEDHSIIKRCIDELPKRINRSNVNIIESKLAEKLIHSPNNTNLKKLSLILLDSLITCDYLSAKEKREESKSPFFKAVISFYNSWMKNENESE